SYDGFGNMTSIAGTGTASATSASFSINAATNHGSCSDANGNTLEVSCSGSYYGYTYDISNRIVVTPGGSPGGTMHYSYAPDNHRVWVGDGGSTDEVTFWSPAGQKLGTYHLASSSDPSAAEDQLDIYFGGKLIAHSTVASGTRYLYQDRIGSIGSYYPYGTDKSGSNPSNGTEKFTGYQRDAETGNDYAVNRYMQPGSGRFMTPDRMSGRIADPGSLNRYAYAGVDPINHVDPTGNCTIDATDQQVPDGTPGGTQTQD